MRGVEASNGMGCILDMGGNVFADTFSRFDSFGHGVPLNGGRGSAKRPAEILVAGWKRDVCNGSKSDGNRYTSKPLIGAVPADRQRVSIIDEHSDAASLDRAADAPCHIVEAAILRHL